MPTTTEWCPPKLFMTHNGVNVFHTYKDDDTGQGAQRHEFTLDAYSDDHSFDVRDLDVPARQMLNQHPRLMQGELRNDLGLKAEWDAWHKEGEPQAVKAILREALDAGLLAAPADNSGPAAPAGYQQVLIKVRRADGATLTAGEAQQIVEYLVNAGEYEARCAVNNDDPEDTEVARQVVACDFSVALP